MLYLIKDAYLNENDEPKKCLKIGYAKNIDDRMVGYGTSNNLNVILLDTRDGGLGLEKLFHYYYRDRIIKLKGNREWMEYDEEIIAEFKKLTVKELFLNYYPNEKERSLKELIFDYFIEDKEEPLNFILNCRKSREFFLIRDYLASPIYFMNDVIYFIDQLQKEFSMVLDNGSKKSFISDFQERFNTKETPEVEEIWGNDYLNNSKTRIEVSELILILNSNGSFETKMKSVCDFLLNPKWYGHIHVSDLGWLPLNMRNYLIQLGPKRILELGCREVDIKRELINQFSGNKLKEEIINLFKVGEKYSSKEIKEFLKNIYNKLNITKTPKATDLEEYFDVKEAKILDPITKKRDRGYEILSLK